MSKSVLVIDTPECCTVCRFVASTYYLHCTLVSNSGKIKDVNVRPDWCPLKPLPEKMTGVVLTEHWGGVKKGWNGCIDAITGGNVDD